MLNNLPKLPMSHSTAWSALSWIVVLASSPCMAQTVDSPVRLEEVYRILDRYCSKCHHYDKAIPDFDILDRNSLVKVPDGENKRPYITAHHPEESLIWKQMTQKQMPPEDEKLQPTPKDLDLVRRWIEQGAEFPKKADRESLSERKIFDVIKSDYQAIDSKLVRNDTRYFSLAHLWNDPDTSDNQLRLVRAGLSKLLNSLSTSPEIVIPRAVDLDQTVFAIRLSDYGWTKEIWLEIAKSNPYAIKRSEDFAKDAYEVMKPDTSFLYLRVDWFISTASRPPLYHTILNLPPNAKDLEKSLGIHVQRNYESGEIARAGFKRSGVSKQNRMVERHEFSQSNGRGYYWKSYDIRENRREAGNFLRRPLEPEFLFKEGPVSFLSPFKHDGGEIIWSLPNGMQAYMLVNEKDVRIDQGPTEIVIDNSNNSGSPEIVNGISCMGCHSRGIRDIDFQDVRAIYEEKPGSKAAKVLQIYPPKTELDALVQADQNQFTAALDRAVSPFLITHPDDGTKPGEAEPITQAAREYRKDLRMSDAIRELGANAPEVVQRLRQISKSSELKVSGFSIESGKVSREDWEKEFSKVTLKLGLGGGMAYP